MLYTWQYAPFLSTIFKIRRYHISFDLIFLFVSEPFYKITVPTVDTVRYDFLVYNLIKAHRPVLLSGPVGTGKTSVAQGVLSRLDPKNYSILTVNMSAQVFSLELITL